MKKKQTIKISLLCLFLVSAICFNAAGQTRGKINKPAAAQPVDAVKKLGVFTNMRFTQEHQYGYSVELWQEKDRLFGLFLSSEGLAGDTPTGLIEDASFDAKTGKLTFRARLSMGTTVDKNKQEVPTRDVYQFKGFLKNQKLTGVLEHTNALTPTATGRKTNVSLLKSKGESASMATAQSYDEWKKGADEILQLRGPKW